MITWEVISHYVRKANNVEVNAMYHSSSFLKLDSKWNGHVQRSFSSRVSQAASHKGVRKKYTGP